MSVINVCVFGTRVHSHIWSCTKGEGLVGKIITFYEGADRDLAYFDFFMITFVLNVIYEQPLHTNIASTILQVLCFVIHMHLPLALCSLGVIYYTPYFWFGIY